MGLICSIKGHKEGVYKCERCRKKNEKLWSDHAFSQEDRDSLARVFRGLAARLVKMEFYAFADKIEDKYRSISPQEFELLKSSVVMHMGLVPEEAGKDAALAQKLSDIEKKWNE